MRSHSFVFLLAILSLCSFQLEGCTTKMDWYSLTDTTAISSNGVWPSATLPVLPWRERAPESRCTLNCAPCPVCPNTDMSYHELLHAISLKTSSDTRNAFNTVTRALKSFLKSSYGTLTTLFQRLTEKVLWLIIQVWTLIIVQVLSSVCSVLATYYLPAAILMSLGIFTSWIFLACRWAFGTLPTWLGIKIGKFILRTLTFKKYFNERTIAGFDSYSVPQPPPKKSAVLLRRANNKEHIGYASCIYLYNKTNALVTSQHNLEEGSELYSLRTGNSIPIKEFRVIFANPKMDIALLAGPPNWESVLGCKGVTYTTIDRLAKCPAQLYTIEDGMWKAHSAKVVGYHENYAQVLSNTKRGFSGAGYFHGKTLLGLHKGHAGGEFNYNLMAPLPAIPGLTSPQYAIESDPPQGLVFPEDIVEEITRTVAKARSDFMFEPKEDIHSMNKQWKYGSAWADEGDESGNGVAAASALTTATVESTDIPTVVEIPKQIVVPSSQEARKETTVSPTMSTKTMKINQGASVTSQDMVVPTGPSQQDLMQNIMNLLVQKIDMAKIEKAIIDQVSAQALKKPRGKRASKKKQSNGEKPLQMSTPGKYQPPNKRSQVLGTLDDYRPSITPENVNRRNGGYVSAPNTQSWVRKQKDSVGPKSGPKPS